MTRSAKLRMNLFVAGLSVALSAAAAVTYAATGDAATATPPSEKLTLHVINRLGYGPKPGDVEAVMKMGVGPYIKAQLHPETIALPRTLTERLAALAPKKAAPLSC